MKKLIFLTGLILFYLIYSGKIEGRARIQRAWDSLFSDMKNTSQYGSERRAKEIRRKAHLDDFQPRATKQVNPYRAVSAEFQSMREKSSAQKKGSY